MPFKSIAQKVWAHTEEGTEALGGKTAVAEWDKETEGKKLPARKRPQPPHRESNAAPRRRPAAH